MTWPATSLPAEKLNTLGHDPTTARSEELNEYVMACICGWKASTILQSEAQAELRQHFEAALEEAKP